MGSLKDVASSGIAERRYVAKKFIYVESVEDVQILGVRWFNDRMAKVEFIAAGDGADDDEGLGGGCHEVIRKVQEDRDNAVDSYGIVDRDFFLSQSKWNVFLETDDDVYETHKLLDGYVHVWRCWEIENYLLHPLAVEHLLADEQGRAPRSIETVVHELHELADRMVVVLAGSLVLSFHGCKQLQQGFGLGEPADTLRGKVEDQIASHISSEAAEKIEHYAENILAFSGGESAPSLWGWLRLLRILEGKRFIFWLKHHYNLKRKIRWQLATLMRDKGQVQEVLDPFVLELVAQ